MLAGAWDSRRNPHRTGRAVLLVALLSVIGASCGGPAGAPQGDPEAGKQAFFGAAGCSTCHMAGGRGGRLGPPLDGSADRDAAQLIESIREPDRRIAEGYEAVAVVTADGERVVGIRRNEDTFSLQMLDRDERLRMLEKRELRDVEHRPGSLMPAYPSERLSEAQLADLLAYLRTL